MGKNRKHAPHIRWSNEETEALIRLFPDTTVPWTVIWANLPRRDRKSIQGKAYCLGLVRPRSAAMSKEEVAKRKREAMGRRRSADIESARAYARKHYANNRDKMKEKLRKAYHSDMFKSRAAKLRADGHATGADLRKKWEEQDGLCALTGRILDKTAQVDHIIPKSKGGGDGIDNVRWVHKDANLAKRGLTDLELLELCHDVIRWLGQRIEATR